MHTKSDLLDNFLFGLSFFSYILNLNVLASLAFTTTF